MPRALSILSRLKSDVIITKEIIIGVLVKVFLLILKQGHFLFAVSASCVSLWEKPLDLTIRWFVN